VNALLQTDIPELKLVSRGKVRDIFELDGDLLMVASDRISAFDHILGSGIPGKGKVLTQISKFWFDKFADVVPNHLITADVKDLPAQLDAYKGMLENRFMRVRRAQMFPVECVVRGYISGSGWKDYQRTGEIGGIRLPEGLRESGKLPEPIFTPATKAESGEHDENISFEKMAGVVGQETALKLRELSIELYQQAARHAETCGILIADTKFEFGVTDDGILLGDEALTPDSSRFWPKDQYEPGRQQASFDKQYVRNYLEEIHWNKQAPAPALPPEVIKGTQDRYLEAYQRLTGQTLEL
jgi:phosphoribosylaminoimidazole-succinocarboxamide synthase